MLSAHFMSCDELGNHTAAMKSVRSAVLLLLLLPRECCFVQPFSCGTLASTNKKCSALFAGEAGTAQEAACRPDEDEGFAVQRKRTLYETLRSPPNATRPELKRAYVALAKQTHPDALLARNDSSALHAPLVQHTDFNDVATAWRTLSDTKQRLKYDRTLKAQQFTLAVENILDSLSKQAGPPMQKAFDTLAIPLLRRTTATTVASFSAAAEQVTHRRTSRKPLASNNNQVPRLDSVGIQNADDAQRAFNFGTVLSTAFEAGRKAGRAMDQFELLEKSKELEGRADQEMAQAMLLKQQLSAVMIKRLKLAMRMPNSKLTSREALIVMDSFKTVDSVSLLDTILLKHTVAYEIDMLKDVEKEFAIKMDEKRITENDSNLKQTALTMAQEKAAKARDAENRARAALNDALALVALAKQEVEECTQNLEKVTDYKKKIALETDAVSLALERRQERVRNTLVRKEEAVIKEQQLSKRQNRMVTNGTIIDSNDDEYETFGNIMTTNDHTVAVLEQLEKLRKEEQDLLAESALAEERAVQLKWKARELLEKSKQLDEET